MCTPGISGNVSIDENGDRNADYSLLDMDPITGIFQVMYSSIFELVEEKIWAFFFKFLFKVDNYNEVKRFMIRHLRKVKKRDEKINDRFVRRLMKRNDYFKKLLG